VAQKLSLSEWSHGFSDTFEETYRWIVTARLQKLGIDQGQVHFINSNVYVYNGGSLHCGTLTLRSKDMLVY
jgi:hypothetical protein